MKVAMRLKTLPRLSETFIYNQIKFLLKKGVQVHLIVSELNYSGVDSLYFEKDLYIHQAINIKPAPQTWRKAFGVFANMRSLIKRGRFFSTDLPVDQFDILHFQYAIFFSEIANYRYKKLLVNGRGFDVTSAFKRNVAEYTKNFPLIDLYLPVSVSLSKPFLAAGFPSERVRVLHSGIELDSFPFSPRVLEKKQSIQLVSVGRLVEKKGNLFAIKAAELLLDRGVKVELSIIGEGPLRGELEEYASRSRWKDSIHIRGPVANKQVAAEMRQADIFVLHCITDSEGNMEGIPNVIKEAMALGVPVATTRHSGNTELLPNGYHRFLCDECDYESMANNILALIELPDNEMQEFLKKNREVVEKNFNIKDLTDELVSIYKNALKV